MEMKYDCSATIILGPCVLALTYLLIHMLGHIETSGRSERSGSLPDGGSEQWTSQSTKFSTTDLSYIQTTYQTPIVKSK